MGRRTLHRSRWASLFWREAKARTACGDGAKGLWQDRVYPSHPGGLSCSGPGGRCADKTVPERRLLGALSVSAVRRSLAADLPTRRATRLWQVHPGKRVDLSFAVSAHRDAPSCHSASPPRFAGRTQACAHQSTARSEAGSTGSHRGGAQAFTSRRAAARHRGVREEADRPMTASDFHGKPVVAESVKHLDADVIVEVLSRHGVNVSEAAVELGVASADLRRLLWARPQLVDAAAEIEEQRLDLAERNIYQALKSSDGRERLAASMFVIRNSHRSRKRGWITSSTSAAELSASANADQPRDHHLSLARLRRQFGDHHV